MLSDENIRELYATATLDADWLGRYQRFVARVAAMTDEELLGPEAQRALWSANDVTGIGPGQLVDPERASRDEEVAQTLVALRHRVWRDDAEARAQEIQSEFERVRALVVSRYSINQPWVQLARVFAALLPADFHCVLDQTNRQLAHRQLLGYAEQRGFVFETVLARARLRDVLGPEQDLSEHVRRSVFCWWVATHARTQAAERLTLWPFPKQRKGLTAPRGFSERYRAVLQAAGDGAARSDIVQTLKDANSNYQTSTLDQAISAVIALGLLEYRDGLLYPTASGRAFWETGVADVLIEPFLVRVFPFAHLLRKLAFAAKPPTALATELQQMYPQWTSALVPNQAIGWAKHLGLVIQTADGLELTESGKAWERRLPEDLPSPSSVELASNESNDEDDERLIESERRAWPNFAVIWKGFSEDEEAKRLILTEHQLASIHAAWHCNPQKRFVLLSGLSGTGKTQVASLYARLYCEHLKLDPKRHIALVPVSPDWRDPSGLLGYFSALHEEPTFHVEPALRLLIDAANDPGRPYFLILDEMNLARVERYFAPFLSAMETGDALTLHGGADEIDGVPPRIKWPTNLFIAGTVNMDETTYPFSDKVLDRAFTFEFWDVDLTAFFEKQEARDETVETVLSRLYEILLPVRRHFGYRTAGEVLAFVKAAPEGHRMALLDQAIFSKVLPRIRGENGDGLRKALAEAQSVCAHHGLERSAKKLAEMQKLLDQTGLTKFWA